MEGAPKEEESLTLDELVADDKSIRVSKVHNKVQSTTKVDAAVQLSRDQYMLV